jgi:hypothetical protein
VNLNWFKRKVMDGDFQPFQQQREVYRAPTFCGYAAVGSVFDVCVVKKPNRESIFNLIHPSLRFSITMKSVTSFQGRHSPGIDSSGDRLSNRPEQGDAPVRTISPEFTRKMMPMRRGEEGTQYRRPVAVPVSLQSSWGIIAGKLNKR